MEIDPATVCARTSAGEAELERAQNGLTLPQRKALSLLAAPRAYAEFATENHLDPERLARDFTRLGELGLISLQLGSVAIAPPTRARAASPPPRHAPAARRPARSVPRAPSPARPDPQLQPVVIGAAPGRSPLKMAALAGAVVVVAIAGWLAMRGGPPATPRVDASAASPAPAPMPVPAPVVATAPAPQEVAATPAAPTAPFSPPATTRPVAIDKQASARDTSAREPRPATNAITTPAPDTSGGAAAQPAAHPMPMPTTISERTPEPLAPSPITAAPAASAPVLVASAAKTPVAAAPSVKSALQPIVREAPEFPKEAMTEGISSGSVKARVTVDAAGKVAGIEILDAQPRRVFDRAVRAALWRWQFEPGAPDRTAEVEIAFVRQ